QLACALLLSLEQPHVLDGDDGLIGKCRNQFDVLVVERPHRATAHQDDTDWTSLAQHRHPQMGAIAAQLLWLSQTVVRVAQNIGDLKGLALKQDSPSKTCSPSRSYKRLVIFNVFRREAITRSNVVASLCRAHDLSHIRLAQSCGGLD